MRLILRAGAMAALAIGAMAIPSRADSLLPGVPQIPGQAALSDTLSAGASALNTASGTFSTGQQVTGSYSTTVYRDSAGNIDFSYTITNTSTSDDIFRLTASPFTGYTTDVGYDSSGVVAVTVDRSNDGSTVGFSFDLKPTQTGTYYINTNARGYEELFAVNGVGGALSISDGGTANLTGFAPAAPAPASLWGGMGLLGLMGVFGMRRRMKLA